MASFLMSFSLFAIVALCFALAGLDIISGGWAFILGIILVILEAIAINLIGYLWDRRHERRQPAKRPTINTTPPRPAPQQPRSTPPATRPTVRSPARKWKCSPCELFQIEHVSYSRLKLFEQCPRRFELVYLVGLHDPVGKAAEVGSVVHSMVDLFTKERTTQRCKYLVDDGTLEQLMSFYEPAIRVVKPQHPIARRDVLPFCASFGRLNRRPLQVVETERHYEALVGDRKLKCIIDRVDKDRTGALTVIDYKTGNPQYVSDRQLNLYGYALDGTQTGSIKLQYQFLKPGDTKTWTFTPRIKDATRMWLDSSMGQIERCTRFLPKRGPLCRYCGVARYCD